MYESAAGYGIAGLRCLSWAFFFIELQLTIKKFPEKRNFYFPFSIFGSVWILAGPILIFLVVGLLDPWIRESVVFISFAIVAFCGHAAFLWLTWPSRANKSFPYHVKTNHIGIASNDDDDDGKDYPRHTYEPATVPDATIIPLSRRTEEFVCRTDVDNKFIRDVEYYHAPYSIPQQCLPTKSIHHRLPSPTHDVLPIISNDNGRLYGKDTLNHEDDNDNDGDNLTPKFEIAKHLKTTSNSNNQLTTFENEENISSSYTVKRIKSLDNDSGHLSLEASTSPNSNDLTNTTPQMDSLESNKTNSPQMIPPPVKENPFKAKLSSRIILDPIKLPTNVASINSSNDVPHHLFRTNKKTEQ